MLEDYDPDFPEPVHHAQRQPAERGEERGSVRPANKKRATTLVHDLINGATYRAREVSLDDLDTALRNKVIRLKDNMDRARHLIALGLEAEETDNA